MWFLLLGLLCWEYGCVASADDEILSWKSAIEEKLIGLEHKVKILEKERNVERRENAKLTSSNRLLKSKMKHLEVEVKHLKQSIEQVQKRTNGIDDNKKSTGDYELAIQYKGHEMMDSMSEERGDFDHEIQSRKHELINSVTEKKGEVYHEIKNRKQKVINSISEERGDYGHEIEDRKHEPINTYEEYYEKYRNRRIVPPTSSPHLDIIAFYCYLSKDTESALSSHHIIQYDVVPTNKGNGYNKDDGIFTVPKSGVYIFTWTTVVGSHSYARTEITVDGHVFGQTVPDSLSTSVYDTFSATVIVEAKSGDHVLIRILSTGVGKINSNGETTTSFAGWLLG